MTILVTGAAGFIGSAVCMKLLDRGEKVVGIDNHNDYYDVDLKQSRLERHLDHADYQHYKIDICDKKKLVDIFEEYKFKRKNGFDHWCYKRFR